MAFLSSSAHTSDNYQGGRGHMGLSWHRMPLPKVQVLKEGDQLGDIEIRWLVDISDGVKAYLNIEEARALYELLGEAIVQAMVRGGVILAPHNGIDNEVDDTETVNGDGSGSVPAWVDQAREHGYRSPRESLGLSDSKEVR
ncbi:hypothetical protein ACIP5Y_00805 [Nocardia sp. NPDC088792]|uniref:hypothetical protein n=1 Tax=Nocardia sp. NPDC088792 TaxID=3364332 RepID=UPI0038304E3F